MEKVGLRAFSKALQMVYPPASYSKVFEWANQGNLATFRDPFKEKSHYQIDMDYVEEFLHGLGLNEAQVGNVLKEITG